MEAYEGHKMDESSLFNFKHQQFFEDVLLPRLRDELHIQRQLMMDSLQEHLVHLPDLGTNTASVSLSVAQTPCASVATVGMEDHPHQEESLHARIVSPEDDTPDTLETEGDQPHQQKSLHARIAAPTADKIDTPQTEVSECLEPESALSKASLLTKAAGKKMGIIFHPAHKRRNGSQARLHRHLHSAFFRIGISLLIAANAIIIGIQTEEEFACEIEGVEPDNAFIWTIFEVTFTTIFSLEILLRLCAEGRLFFQGDLGFWNTFDAVLVAQALFSLLGEGVFWFFIPNYSFVRVLRILRFFRVLRVLRVMKNFRSFRVMIISLGNSLQSLLWVLFMLAFVVYLFSIIILRCIMASFHRLDDIGPAKQQLFNSYGGLAQTSLSLFMAITGGRDWADLYRPLARLDGPSGLVFVCYIFFSVFGVLNVVTSMFVDSVNGAALSDHHYLLQCEKDRRKQYAKACRAFFIDADANRSGKLSWKEFNKYLKLNRNKARLATLDLDALEARALWTLVDVNGKGSVDIEDFVRGCARLKGPATAIDVCMLSNENGKFISHANDFMDCVQAKLEAIVTKVGALATIEQSSIDTRLAKMTFSDNGVSRNDMCKTKSDEHTQNVEHKPTEQDACTPRRTLGTTIPDVVPDCTPQAPVLNVSL